VATHNERLSAEQLSQATARQLTALKKIEEHPSEVVIGIDEVGCGPWAGPISIGVAVMPKKWRHKDVKDSKATKLSARAGIVKNAIIPNALFYAVLSAPSTDIDRYGLGVIRRNLTESAGIMARLRFPGALLVQDGVDPVPIDGTFKNIIFLPKADALVPAVSAASILAKNERDTFMQCVAHPAFPQYDFEHNMGYRNIKHELALKKDGPCPYHRRSFSPVKKLLLATG